jgi:hypothetical protein
VEKRMVCRLYQPRAEPVTVARAKTAAIRFCTGISSGRELTARRKLYPFWGRFQEVDVRFD